MYRVARATTNVAEEILAVIYIKQNNYIIDTIPACMCTSFRSHTLAILVC